MREMYKTRHDVEHQPPSFLCLWAHLKLNGRVMGCVNWLVPIFLCKGHNAEAAVMG